MKAADANAPRTEGLTTLDRDRAGSIADEGGASAAVVEAQPPPPAIDPDETPPRPRKTPAKRARRIGER